MTGGAPFERLRAMAEATATRVAALEARALTLPVIGTGVRAFRRYNEAGGGLVSRGLAFAILFALVPAILLVSSLAALFIGDPSSRDRILAALAEQFPPLAPILGESVNSAVAVAPTTSLISLVVLLWSASGMVRALDVAIALVFREQEIPRSPLRLVGLVLAVGGALLGLTIAIAVASLSGPIGDLVGIGLNTRLGAFAVLGIVVVLAYRLLPRHRPSWRVTLVPGLIATLALGALWVGFAVLSPLLLGSVEVFGALAVVFLGIVWLGFSTDVFLIGAAWAAVSAEDAALGAARALGVAAIPGDGTVADGDRPGI